MHIYAMGYSTVFALSHLLIRPCALSALLEALEKAIAAHRHGDAVPPAEAHKQVKQFYTWQDVAKRTEYIYDSIARDPETDCAQQMRR